MEDHGSVRGERGADMAYLVSLGVYEDRVGGNLQAQFALDTEPWRPVPK